MLLVCQSCGQSFERPPGYVAKYDARFCSNACRSRRVNKECPICHEWFSVKTSHADKRITCSKECAGKWATLTHVGEKAAHWQGGQILVPCEQCGQHVAVDPHAADMRRFCSRACRGKWMSTNNLGEHGYNWQGGQVEIPCRQCGQIFSVDRHRQDRAVFCSKHCYSLWQSANITGEAHPNWKGGYEPYYGPDWETQRRKARERDGFTCQLCGTTEFEIERSLDVHHIAPFRIFGIECHQAANEINNLISLCPTCHGKAERDPSLLRAVSL